MLPVQTALLPAEILILQIDQFFSECFDPLPVCFDTIGAEPAANAKLKKRSVVKNAV